jgi:hypothetical protein
MTVMRRHRPAGIDPFISWVHKRQEKQHSCLYFNRKYLYCLSKASRCDISLLNQNSIIDLEMVIEVVNVHLESEK